MSASDWWVRRRQTLTLGMLLTSLTGKALALLGLGALLAAWLRPWAWGLLVVGITLDLAAKWRWLRRTRPVAKLHVKGAGLSRAVTELRAEERS